VGIGSGRVPCAASSSASRRGPEVDRQALEGDQVSEVADRGRHAGDLDRPCAGAHAFEVKGRQPLGDEVDDPVGSARADVVLAVEEDGGKGRPVHPGGRPAGKQLLELFADRPGCRHEDVEVFGGAQVAVDDDREPTHHHVGKLALVEAGQDLTLLQWLDHG